MNEEMTQSIISFFAENPTFFMLIIIALVIIGWSLINGIVKICKKIKIKKLGFGSFNLELDNPDISTPKTASNVSPTVPLEEECVEEEPASLPITIPFESFNMMIRHCVKAAIDAINGKVALENETLAQQNKNAQVLLDEVMAKVTREYHDKKINENKLAGGSNPEKDFSILIFQDNFSEDFRNIVYPRIGQFFSEEALAFTDEVDLANMCKRLEVQIIQAIEDRFSLKDSYVGNQQLAKDSFEACKNALNEAIDNALHKAKKISITGLEDIKKLIIKKDEDINSFIKASTQKEIKGEFIAKEVLEGE